MAKKERRVSRAQRKQALLDAAAQVALPPTADLCVVGGGAAGLAAANCAANTSTGGQTRVVVLEGSLECGLPILATGNGRCNFVNARLDPALYNDPTFVGTVTGDAWLDDVLTFFRDVGLAWEQEDGGRCYPLSRQAASVRNVLLACAKATNVTLAPARMVTGIERTGGGFVVSYEQQWGNRRKQSLAASRVIIATGGGVSSCCEGLGLKAAPFAPMLCPLACEGPLLGALDGRRVRAEVSLTRKGQRIAREKGEVLFRPYGVSGIVVFNLSRHALPGDELVLDVLPDLALDEAQGLAARTLDGLLDPVIAQALLCEAGTRAAAVTLSKALPYRVVGRTETSHAQVNRGGLETSQFDPRTLAAKDVPGLYACGEALDVDGPCGGFNLAWAWKSGMVAGYAAADTGTAKGASA